MLENKLSGCNGCGTEESELTIVGTLIEYDDPEQGKTRQANQKWGDRGLLPKWRPGQLLLAASGDRNRHAGGSRKSDSYDALWLAPNPSSGRDSIALPIPEFQVCWR